MDEINIDSLLEGLGEIENPASGGQNPASGNETPGSGAGASNAETGRRKRRKTEEENTPRPVVLDIPAPAEPTEKKKRSSKKKEAGTTIAADPILETNVTTLLKGSFDIMAVPLGAHWSITPLEAATVAQPAARILTRLGASETTNKYADYFVLLGAIAAITIPRAMISSAMKKAKEGSAKNVLPYIAPTGGKQATGPKPGSFAAVQPSVGSGDKQPSPNDTGTIKGAISGIL